VTHDRPSPVELVTAVREFLDTEILRVVDDRRLRFRTLVASNALGIAERELVAREKATGSEPPAIIDLEGLARRIRVGDVQDGMLEVLKRHVAAKLAVASPGYLERYG
jgi:hypothetical protein